MRFTINLKLKIKKFCFILVFLIILTFQNDFQKLNALNMQSHQDEIVVEELRLKVPSPFKEVWIENEKSIWEPWLSSQKGFLGRQLFWDKEKEEALILVNWQSKKLWKNIPMSEVKVIQEKFEDNVKNSLNVRENPFELIYEGELDKQG